MLTLRYYPDPILKQKCQPVIDFELVRACKEEFLRLMRAHEGAGLAANQVGLPWRMLAIECEGLPAAGPMILCNPRILEQGGMLDLSEGCLSLPGLRANLMRAATLRLAWEDENGQPQEGVFEGFASMCIQHEMDHLDGVLMLDRLSPLKSQLAVKKLRKLAKERVSG